jgi:hypothetical protein
MSQILHIFKKDARHLWPEILISLALTATFVRVSFGGVSNFNGGSSSNLLPLFASMLAALVPVGWWVLTARLIHDESLVGESQFWVTRPYQWQELLTAKALFLVAFLYLPICIAQVVLLAGAGFHPSVYLPGLFYNLVLLTGVLVLPITAIATVTSNFARLVLTLLGAVAYLALIMWALNFVHPTGQLGFPNPYEDKLTFSLFFLVFLVVIVLQYATRRTWRSRGLLLVLPFLAIACSLAWPIKTIARHLYPPLAAAEPPPVLLTLDPDPDRQNSVNPSHERTRIDLYLPLTVSSISSDSAVQNQAVQVSIESPNGLRWQSKWQNVSKYYRPDTSRSFIDIPINEQFFDRVKSTPVTVTLTFALIQLHVGTSVTSQTGDQDFTLAGGICSFPTPFSSYPECRFAMTGPELAFVTSRWTDGPCPQTAPSAVPGTPASTWVGTIDPSPAEFGIDPVKMKPLVFPYPPDTRHPNSICPGTPITASPYSVVRRLQTTLAIPNLDLTKYTIDRFDGPTRSRVTARTR